MAIRQLWPVVVLIFASITVSRSSILSKRLECPMQGASFGGRLVLMDGGVLRARHSPAWAESKRMIIFQTPPAHLRSHMGFGWGKIWIGSRNCERSSVSQPGQCPWTGDRPCLDTGMLCITEPACYDRSNKPYPLEFSEVTEDSITVSWPAWDETTDSGVGPVTGYKILYRQKDNAFEEILLDSNSLSHRFDGLNSGSIYQFRMVLMRDGEPPECPPTKIQNETTLCRELGSVNLLVKTWWKSGTTRSRFNISWHLPDLTEECNVTHQQITLHQLDNDNCNFSLHALPKEYDLDTGTRQKTLKNLSPNSRYNITYFARNSAGPIVISQVNRTAEAEPTGAPRNLIHETKRRRRVEFAWNEPTCGERNGNINHYEVVALKNEVEVNGERTTVHRTQYIMRHLSLGDQWTFKVRACNEADCGPYAETSGEIE